MAADCSALAGWHAVRSPRDAVALCVPPDYVRVKGAPFWTRVATGQYVGPRTVAPYAGDDFLYVTLMRADDVLRADAPWPPSLLRDRAILCADCLTAESFTVHWDTLRSGRVIRVETARVSGGYVGVHDKPALLATWPLPDGSWILVQAQAGDVGELKRLRRAVRTIRAAQ